MAANIYAAAVIPNREVKPDVAGQL